MLPGLPRVPEPCLLPQRPRAAEWGACAGALLSLLEADLGTAERSARLHLAARASSWLLLAAFSPPGSREHGQPAVGLLLGQPPTWLWDAWGPEHAAGPRAVWVAVQRSRGAALPAPIASLLVQQGAAGSFFFTEDSELHSPISALPPNYSWLPAGWG